MNYTHTYIHIHARNNNLDRKIFFNIFENENYLVIAIM